MEQTINSPVLKSESKRRFIKELEPLLKQQKTRNYSTVIFFFLVLSLFGWYAIRPTIQTILYLQREIQDLSALNLKMDEKVGQLIEAQAQYAEAKPKLTYVGEAIPKDPDTMKLLTQIRNLAASTGVTISQLSVSSVPLLFGNQSATKSAGKQSASSGSIVALPISIAVDGTYAAVKSFTSSLLSTRRIMVVDSETLTPIKKESTTSAATTQQIHNVLQVISYYGL